MSTFNAASIRKLIADAGTQEAELLAVVADDAAFHLTDWLSDLEHFVAFCSDPGAYTPAQVNALLVDFLIHVPNHLAAAAKLYADQPVTDIFDLGAVA